MDWDPGLSTYSDAHIFIIKSRGMKKERKRLINNLTSATEVEVLGDCAAAGACTVCTRIHQREKGKRRKNQQEDSLRLIDQKLCYAADIDPR